ncbi:MAG: iron chelate uptake ABC transporter family permease subunit, partial [Vulcanimicrobiaceae bacterium]
MTRPAILAALVFALVVAIAIAADSGAVGYSPAAIASAIVHPHANSDTATVLWSLRFPRIAIAAFVGAALALSGTLMQDLLGNPLVDPYLTGASAGAALAIAVAIAIGVPEPAYAALALAASLGTTFLVAMLARTATGLSVERMIVAGIALSSLFAGLTTLVILWTPSSTVSLNILSWLGGSLVGHGWRDLAWACLY